MSIAIYLVRHGEIEHHRSDVSLTPRGQRQAKAAAAAFAARLADGDMVFIYHSPVTRVRETADLLYAGLSAVLAAARPQRHIRLHPPQPDPALCNVRFILGPSLEPEEPSLLYTQVSKPAYLQSLPPARAKFYRGFWASADPMGYWLTHDSAGGAETVEEVWARLRERLRGIVADNARDAGTNPSSGERAHWICVSHSGSMRAMLYQAFAADPGEPDFCEAVIIEPSGQTDQVTLSYRGRVAPLALSAGSAAREGR